MWMWYLLVKDILSPVACFFSEKEVFLNRCPRIGQITLILVVYFMWSFSFVLGTQICCHVFDFGALWQWAVWPSTASQGDRTNGRLATIHVCSLVWFEDQHYL